MNIQIKKREAYTWGIIIGGGCRSTKSKEEILVVGPTSNVTCAVRTKQPDTWRKISQSGCRNHQMTLFTCPLFMGPPTGSIHPDRLFRVIGFPFPSFSLWIKIRWINSISKIMIEFFKQYSLKHYKRLHTFSITFKILNSFISKF